MIENGSENREKVAKNREACVQRFAISPINGARIPVGAHPLNSGGKPGRSGRPKEAIRADLRATLDKKGLRFLRDMMAGKVEGSTPGDRLRAVALALRYCLGPDGENSVEMSEVKKRVAATLDAIRSEIPAAADQQRLVDRLRVIWSPGGGR